MENTHAVYCAVIGDGYLYEVTATDDDAPESPSYWRGLQLQEVSCPRGCDGSERAPVSCFYCDYMPDQKPDPECSECNGDGIATDACEVCADTGLTMGEPFIVYRLDGLTEDGARLVVEEVNAGGDGYERMRNWNKSTHGGAVEVCEWNPHE